MNVYVTVYEHKYGIEVRIFTTEQLAKAYRDDIAAEWWDDEFPDEDRPLTDIGEVYFDWQARKDHNPEFFAIYERPIEDSL